MLDAHEIKKACARAFGVSVAEIDSTSRDAQVVLARHTAMYCLHKLFRPTSVWIARQFNRDHATVLHAIKAVENYRATGHEHAKTVDNLLKTIQLKMEPKD